MAAEAAAMDAETWARRLLGRNARRLAHSAGVARAAARVASTVRRDEVKILVAAAWLHDIGYAADVVDTGFHPLDGARYLRSQGVPDRLCCLVANHTHAWVEAEARELGEVLASEFPAEHSDVADALTYADLTTGPDGEPVAVEARIAEILVRYEPGHVVHESIRRAAAGLIEVTRALDPERSSTGASRSGVDG